MKKGTKTQFSSESGRGKQLVPLKTGKSEELLRM